MTTLVARERACLSDTFEALGPDQPTLCEGWLTRDLAAHVIVRERRPDAAGGILLPPLAGYTDKVMRDVAAQPWPTVVRQLRGGPPWWSPTRIPGLDELVNLTEYYVHHEDARRGSDPSARRERDDDLENALWGALGRSARLLLRQSPVGVDVQCPGRKERPLTSAGRGEGRVTLVGEPSEVLLRVFGRGIDDPSVVDVEVLGEPSAVQRFAAFSPGL